MCPDAQSGNQHIEAPRTPSVIHRAATWTEELYNGTHRVQHTKRGKSMPANRSTTGKDVLGCLLRLKYWPAALVTL